MSALNINSGTVILIYTNQMIFHFSYKVIIKYLPIKYKSNIFTQYNMFIEPIQIELNLPLF